MASIAIGKDTPNTEATQSPTDLDLIPTIMVSELLDALAHAMGEGYQNACWSQEACWSP